MPDPLEARVAALEEQVAELMKMKRRFDREDIAKHLRGESYIQDAYIVEYDNPFVAKGVYCPNCWDNHDKLTSIDMGEYGVPRYDQAPANRICPCCSKNLSIRFLCR